MINQTMQINGLANHLSCQCGLNGVQISEDPRFLSDSPSESIHSKQLIDHHNAAQPLTIPLKFKEIPKYFDVHSLYIVDCRRASLKQIN